MSKPARIEIKILTSLVAVLLFIISAKSQAQRAELVKLDSFLETVKAPSEKIKLYNFWATWCVPCIKEIPLFENVNQTRRDVKVVLVSMDMVQDPNPEKINRFIMRKKILSEVLIMNENNPTSWISKIDKQWNGNIPVTLIVNTTNGKRKFIDRQLVEGEIEKFIEEVK